MYLRKLHTAAPHLCVNLLCLSEPRGNPCGMGVTVGQVWLRVWAPSLIHCLAHLGYCLCPLTLFP